MAELTIDDAVVDWAIDCPESIAVFEKHGLEYCCGGKSLAYVCKQRGLDPHIDKSVQLWLSQHRAWLLTGGVILFGVSAAAFRRFVNRVESRQPCQMNNIAAN